jgi:peptidoglycan/LPS O-acetylase OafA/YrhL
MRALVVPSPASVAAASAAPLKSAKPSNENPFHIPSLDGIRAVSFLIVFLSHAGLERLVPGGFGVTVFFFLSGYLITTLLRMEAEKSGTIDLRGFYLRRVFRIFPPFYLFLGLFALLHVVHVSPGAASLRATLQQALHFGNYAQAFGMDAGKPIGTKIFWSLAVEEHFYLLFPLAYLALRRWLSPAKQVAALAAVCAAMLAWRYVLVYGYDVHFYRTFLATDTRADSILFGCMLAIVCNPMLDPLRFRPRMLVAAALVGAAVLLFTLGYRNDGFRETLRYTLQGFALAPLFVVAIVYHKTKWFAWLNVPAVRYVGVLSYSLYLVHYGAIEIVRVWVKAGPVAQGTIALAISFVAAALVHHYVERPAAQLRKRFSGAHKRERAARLAAEIQSTAAESTTPATMDACIFNAVVKRAKPVPARRAAARSGRRVRAAIAVA